MHTEILIRQLEYLVALARERHFGRAAASCHISQPTLSGAIRSLESALGVTVVLRGRQFEGFTEEGIRVLGWARRILAERDALVSDVTRFKGELTSTVRIGAIPTAIPVTPLVTKRFTARNPSARVNVESLPSREIGRRLAEFELDGGLTYLDEETPPHTRRVELYRETFYLVIEENEPLAAADTVEWADTADLRLCVLSPQMRNRRILDAATASVGTRITPALEADSVATIYAHVARNRLPSIVTQAWLYAFGVPAGMCIVPMREIGLQPVVGLIILDTDPPTPAAKALIAAMREAHVVNELQGSVDGMRCRTR